MPASRSLILLFIITLLPVHTSRTIELLSSLLMLVLVDLFLSILGVLACFGFVVLSSTVLGIPHFNILNPFLGEPFSPYPLRYIKLAQRYFLDGSNRDYIRVTKLFHDYMTFSRHATSGGSTFTLLFLRT